MQDRKNGRTGLFKVVINNDIIKLVPMANFPLRLGHPFPDHVFAVLGTRMKPMGKLVGRRWKNENAGKVAIGDLFQLAMSLPVNVEQKVPTRIQARLHFSFRRAIGIAENLRMFEKAILRDHGGKGRVVYEVVVLAIRFP